MKYIYTGRFECPLDLVERSIRIGVNCKLPNFKDMIKDALKKAFILRECFLFIMLLYLVFKAWWHM